MNAHPDNTEKTQCLDEALEDTFPASDPPSMTSPSAATPSDPLIEDSPGHQPMHVYRVVNADQAANPFAPVDDGGRWTPPGAACVYTSLTPGSALLEYLAHLQGPVPEGTMLAVARVPPGTAFSECNEPSTWRHTPYRPEVQQVGAAWLESARSLALRVPSALCDGETNLLLNPAHEGFAALELQELHPLPVDTRLRS